MREVKIGIIGAGNMGKAYYKVLGEAYGYEQLFLCDRNEAHYADLPGENKYTDDQLNEFSDQADVIIVAVKPQSFAELSKKLKIGEQTIISIMAGISLEKLENGLSSKKVVRAMPNLSISYKKGVTGWVAGDEVDCDLVEEIFGLTGLSIALENESQINSFTAISGSGPAYFFLLAESMAKAAMKFGFSEKDANKMATETLIGASILAKNSDCSLSELRASVTSKGGTTEAALNAFNESDFDDIIFKAVTKAKERAEELNKET